jgi:hypothetical protein
VTLVALAFSAYGVVALDVLNQDSERAIAEPTLNNLWQDISDDGVYDATDGGVDFEATVSRESLPDGRIVSVRITRLGDDGSVKTVEHVRFAPDATVDTTPPGNPPERAQTATRSIPIRTAPGSTDTGTLRVEVWNT